MYPMQQSSFVLSLVKQSTLAAATLLLVACGGGSVVYDGKDSAPSRVPVDVASVPDAVPRHEPRSKYGNPSSYVVHGKRYYVQSSSQGHVERGIASWYGTKFHGRRTSSGEPYNMYAMTAAHKTLPLPTYVEVTNLKNGRKVIVKVNDRGPFHENRIIDLSYTAASKLGILANGTGLVEIRAIDPSSPTPQPASNTQWAANSTDTRASSVNTTISDEVGLYLQLGAFATQQNAINLKNRLSIYSSKVSLQETWKEGKRFYRVRIGPLASVEAADEITNVLVSNGFTLPSVVID